MDFNQSYKTIESKLQNCIDSNSKDIRFFSESGWKRADVRVDDLVGSLRDTNSTMKKAFGEIVRLRRTIKNVSKAYEAAIDSHIKAHNFLVEELDKLVKENEELKFRLDSLEK